MDALHPHIHWEPDEPRPRSSHYIKAPITNAPSADQVESEPIAAAVPVPALRFLAPIATHIAVRAVDVATTLTVSITFLNRESTDIREGYFSFPLPSGCALYDFRCSIGNGKTIHSQVRPVGKALAEFKGALHNKKTAALIRQETPEIFTAGLGNVPTGTEVRVEVSVVLLLKEKLSGDNRSSQVHTLTIPWNIAPRFGEPPSRVVAAAGGKNVETSLSIDLQILVSNKIVSITSATHKISHSITNGTRPVRSWKEFLRIEKLEKPMTLATVSIDNELYGLDGDFVLDIVTKPNGTDAWGPQALLETHLSLRDHHALVLTIPAASLIERPTREPSGSEILFLADQSGSMRRKLPALKSAMRFFLNGVPPGSKFNIWSFGTSHSSLWSSSRVKNEASHHEAMDHVQLKFGADMGGTRLLPALEAIFNARSNDESSVTDVILVTDGEVWDEENVVSFVEYARKHSEYRVRFFCLGIGAAVSHTLIEGIARAGGGYGEVVPADHESGWENRVVLMVQASLCKHIRPIEWEIGEHSSGKFQRWEKGDLPHSPSKARFLNPFITNRIFVLLEPPLMSDISQARFSFIVTDAEGGKTVYVIRPRIIPGSDVTIHTLAARSLLDDLARGWSWLHSGYPSEAATRHEGERIGCKYGLLSKWTSLVAVEDGSSNGKGNWAAGGHSISVSDRDLLRPLGPAPAGLWTRITRLSTNKTGDSEPDSSSDSDSDPDPDPNKPPPPPPAPAGGPPSGAPSENPGPISSGGGASGENESASCPSGPPGSKPTESSQHNLQPGSSASSAPKYSRNEPETLNLSQPSPGGSWPCLITRAVASDSLQGDHSASQHRLSTLSSLTEGSPWHNSMGDPGNSDLDGKAVVKTLVEYQEWNGAFDFGNWSQECLAALFGANVGDWYLVQGEILRELPNHERSHQVVLTSVITTLLQTRIGHWKSLWLLLVERADDFISQELAVIYSANASAPEISGIKETFMKTVADMIGRVNVTIKTHLSTQPSTLQSLDMNGCYKLPCPPLYATGQESRPSTNQEMAGPSRDSNRSKILTADLELRRPIVETMERYAPQAEGHSLTNSSRGKVKSSRKSRHRARFEEQDAPNHPIQPSSQLSQRSRFHNNGAYIPQYYMGSDETPSNTAMLTPPVSEPIYEAPEEQVLVYRRAPTFPGLEYGYRGPVGEQEQEQYGYRGHAGEQEQEQYGYRVARR